MATTIALGDALAKEIAVATSVKRVRDEFTDCTVELGYLLISDGVLARLPGDADLSPTIGLTVVTLRRSTLVRVAATVGGWHEGLARAAGSLRTLPAGWATAPVVTRPLSAVNGGERPSSELVDSNDPGSLRGLVEAADRAARQYVDRIGSLNALLDRIPRECSDPDVYGPLACLALGDEARCDVWLSDALARRESRTDAEATAYREVAKRIRQDREALVELLRG